MCFSVLSYGHDALLLTTRDLLLSREGFQVLSASDRTEALHLLAAQNIDLLLPCHSLSEEEFQSILAVAGLLARPPRVLALLADSRRETSLPTYAVVNTGDGPENLLAAVHGLINKNGGASLPPKQLMEPQHV